MSEIGKHERLREAAEQARVWEYKADNLKKIAGMMLETKFNERGREGWEFVAVADNYAIFKRRALDRPG